MVVCASRGSSAIKRGAIAAALTVGDTFLLILRSRARHSVSDMLGRAHKKARRQKNKKYLRKHLNPFLCLWLSVLHAVLRLTRAMRGPLPARAVSNHI
jgi:hypothetical protein